MIKLPINYIGIVKNNPHKVPSNTKFIIKTNLRNSYYDYEVEFIGKQFKRLNDTGPFLSNKHIKLNKVEKLLYERE